MHINSISRIPAAGFYPSYIQPIFQRIKEIWLKVYAYFESFWITEIVTVKTPPPSPKILSPLPITEEASLHIEHFKLLFKRAIDKIFPHSAFSELLFSKFKPVFDECVAFEPTTIHLQRNMKVRMGSSDIIPKIGALEAIYKKKVPKPAPFHIIISLIPGAFIHLNPEETHMRFIAERISMEVTLPWYLGKIIAIPKKIEFLKEGGQNIEVEGAYLTRFKTFKFDLQIQLGAQVLPADSDKLRYRVKIGIAQLPFALRGVMKPFSKGGFFSHASDEDIRGWRLMSENLSFKAISF